MFTFADLWTVARTMLLLLGVIMLAGQPWLLGAGVATTTAVFGIAWYHARH